MITVNNSIVYEDETGGEVEFDAANFEYENGTDLVLRGSKLIGITEEAIELGGVTPLGFITLKNLDPTNYVDVKTGTGGVIFARLRPNGGSCQIFAGSDITAPYAIANTAPCLIDKLITAS